MEINFRAIAESDNKPLAELIRKIFREFNIARPGTVYTDPTTDHLYELFQAPGSGYIVAEVDGFISGGCGIFPTPGLPAGCAELVKFYLLREARGKGVGRQLMQKSIDMAVELDYNQLYLESLPELGNAVSMYLKAGFSHLKAPLGNSGHFGCTIWMIKDL